MKREWKRRVDLDDEPPAPPRPVRPIAPPPPGPTPEDRARIRQLLANLTASFSLPGSRLYSPDDPVQIHAERLTQRGLEGGAAWRQAREMVADPEHRAGCAICGGQRDEEVPF